MAQDVSDIYFQNTINAVIPNNDVTFQGNFNSKRLVLNSNGNRLYLADSQYGPRVYDISEVYLGTEVTPSSLKNHPGLFHFLHLGLMPMMWPFHLTKKTFILPVTTPDLKLLISRKIILIF